MKLFLKISKNFQCFYYSGRTGTASIFAVYRDFILILHFRKCRESVYSCFDVGLAVKHGMYVRAVWRETGK